MTAGERVDLPESLNIADRFLSARVREGLGDKTAIVAGPRRLTYAEVDRGASRFAEALRALGVDPEQRVLIGLPDVPEFATSLFGTLKNGSVVVMVNCHLKPAEIAYFYQYTRAKIAVVHADQLEAFLEASASARDLDHVVVVGGAGEIPSTQGTSRAQVHAWPALVDTQPGVADAYPTHRDDAAFWLFSGGTTGRPKAVVQTHRSFANTTELYAHRVIGYRADDITMSVPKLYFGYATGSNLLFPFSAGATVVLFPERCTADALFAQIREHRPTLLVNAPTMVNNLVSHPEASKQDFSSIRVSTSAGEALPVELYERWKKTFGVELCDGLGTAEMWHIFISNRPDDVTPGTLGKVVPGFEVRVCDDAGRDVPDGDVGWLWVRGQSRALGYHQELDKTMSAFKGEWYVSGDMIRRATDGTITYCGRGDDMLKVGGKWLSPSEVENCLLSHPLVSECAVVGSVDSNGLTKPHAFVVAREPKAGLEDELKAYVREKLEPYKAPRRVFLRDSLPRTHLGKVDRGKLRAE